MLSPILALFARINRLLWLNIRSTGAEVAGGQKTFCSSGCSTLNVSLCATSTQDQDRDRDLRVPRPTPRPRPILRGSRPRPRARLVKTGLKTKTQVSRTPSLVYGMYCQPAFSELLVVFVAGAVDELNSPSARLTVGRVMKAGTGCFDVVIPVTV